MSCVSLPMNAPSSIVVGCFCVAVVVAGDRAGADVDACADDGVAQVRQVHALEPSPSDVFFISTKLPTFARAPTVASPAEVRERSDAGSSVQSGLRDDAVVVDDDAVANPRVDDAHAAVQLAAAHRSCVRPSSDTPG